MTEVRLGQTPLLGLDTAHEFFIDGIASIQFLGVNTRYVLFKNVHDATGALTKKVEFTVVMPTGGLCGVIRQLAAFALDHRIRVPQDAT